MTKWTQALAAIALLSGTGCMATLRVPGEEGRHHGEGRQGGEGRHEGDGHSGDGRDGGGHRGGDDHHD